MNPTSMDRFSTGVTPIAPDEVGDCNGCGGMMYDYELCHCHSCDASIHTSCREKCAFCGADGCRHCLIELDTGELICLACSEDCKPEENP